MSNRLARRLRPPVFVSPQRPVRPRPRIAEGSGLHIMGLPVASTHDDVELTRPLETLMADRLSPADAFLLSRVAAGAMSVDALANTCPFGRDQALAMIRRHLCETGLLRLARSRTR